MPSNTEKIKDKIGKAINVIGNVANNISNYYYMTHPNFMDRSIGLANRLSYNWKKGVEENLKRNIGELKMYVLNDRERVATPIGELANPEYTQDEGKPWFLTDEEKSRYYDYLDYIDNIYFKGSKKLINFENPNGIREVDFDNGDFSKTEPGVIHHIDTEEWEVPSPSLNSSFVWDTSIVNPNNLGKRDSDTRLGAMSSYYLVKTLENTRTVQEGLSYSGYVKPKDTTDAKTDLKKKTKYGNGQITRGVYSNFGLDGNYGFFGKSTVLSNASSGLPIASSKELIGEIIPWSTADSVYDTRLIAHDLDRVQGIQRLENQNEIDYVFLDKAQGTEASHEYFPFGNYYSITYSLGLVGASGENTQKAIANSMLGYPLTRSNDIDNSGLLTGDSADKIVVSAYKKYYVGNGTRGTNYIDKMTACTVKFIKFGKETKNKNIVRLELIDVGNDNLWAARSVFQHREAEGNKLDSPLNTNGITNYNKGIAWGNYQLFDKDVIATKPDIIRKTNELFMNNKIKTIIGRFHTDEVGNKQENRMDNDFIGSATSKYGASRGRNLLRRDHGNGTNETKGNGYSNPYCRVWTYHHEYSTLEDLIRPFTDESLDGSEISKYRTMGSEKVIFNGIPYENTVISWDSGQKRLEKYGARIKSNKLVRFCPTRDKHEEIKDQLKRLMFSIENLAWKDCAQELDEDQRGPLGGRIMWFPPYNLEFNEQVSTNWNEVEFIGRGEKIPTYINTTRSGNLSFDILVDHPSIVNSFNGKGVGGMGVGDVDDTESYEQTLLRFFAGCEILDKDITTTVIEEEPPKPNPPTPVTVEVPEVIDQGAFSFYIFYPNNYTGIEDDPNYFANYILSGIGSGYAKTNRGMEDYIDKCFGYNGYEMEGTRNNSVSEGLNKGYTTVEKFNDKISVRGEDDIKWCSYFEGGSCNDTEIDRGIRKSIHEWGYRIDSKYRCQRLLKEVDYCDTKSYGMNSSNGYKDAIKALTKEEATDKEFAFSEVYAAFNTKDDVNNLKDRGMINENRVEELKSLIKDLESRVNSDTSNTSISVNITGYASSQGHAVLNKELSRNRGECIESWLANSNRILFGTIKANKDNYVPFDVPKTDVDLYMAKVSRAAKVTISFVTEELVGDKNNINILDNKMEESMQRQQIEYNDIMLSNDKNASAIARTNVVKGALDFPKFMRTMTNVEWWDRWKSETEWERQAKEKDIIPEAWSKIKEEGEKEFGYKNEYKFFSELEKTDTFLHNKIVDKIKFFDPAFHSITPEGYQARLTFLHQCTRQGSTSAWTDNSSIRSAANLAFGRPPILVLRIGDFYNTKIAITSLNIDFKTNNGVSWDLNDEGIGIMPMYAHISIGFNFYGGSDLGGPISRLQNAVSFNYYANTSVYDKRSEMVEYNDDGTLARVKQVDIK